jgi:diketogulonate reductase-like aldo/keto reductase
VDTASVYDNEQEVGQAIEDSDIPREQIFIQTKLWRSFVGTLIKSTFLGGSVSDPESERGK